ncbi:MAG TPA: hypothetical protein VHE78_10975 [Gemmatimonadaceae bacterium]|nr:hypothetical protein [Gemmatimonadaceae bacterium]
MTKPNLVGRAFSEVVPIVLLVLLFAGAAALSWTLLSRPTAREQAGRVVAPMEPGFFSVAGSAVDIDVVAPDGRHTPTASPADSASIIPASEGHVECDNYGDPHSTEANCTASVVVKRPAYGEYHVVVSSADTRSETLNVGWGGEGFRRAGGFDVRVVLEARGSTSFTVIVAPEGASLRSQARP